MNSLILSQLSCHSILTYYEPIWLGLMLLYTFWYHKIGVGIEASNIFEGFLLK